MSSKTHNNTRSLTPVRWDAATAAPLMQAVSSMKKCILFLLLWTMSDASYAGSLSQQNEKALLDADLIVLNKLKPKHLITDLNGDGDNDTILFVEDKKTKKKGLCIIHFNSNSCLVIGAGKKSYAADDDFRWVDYWEILPAGESWESTFTPDGDVLGEKKITLNNKSIRLCVEEGGCGLITYNNGEYRWVSQGD